MIDGIITTTDKEDTMNEEETIIDDINHMDVVIHDVLYATVTTI